MASPIITPIPVQTATEYRPISRLAVVGLLLAIPSIFLFVSANLSWLFFLFTLPGFVLAVVSLRAIRRSDGALAGETVALLGVVLSVACGLGWVTAEVVSKVVTEMEARRTADDWLNKVRKGQPGAAFLMTQQARKRQDLRFNPEEYHQLRKQFPDAQQASFYDSFIADPVYSQLLRHGENAKVEYRGLVDQQSRPGMVLYSFKYRLTTPEMEGDLILSVRTEDVQTDQGVRREWLLGYDRNASLLTFTRYGEEILYAQTQVGDVIEKLVFAVANEKRDAIDQVLAQDPAKRGEFELVYGYLRNKVENAGVVMGLQKPVRLRSARKEGNSWVLVFDCTTQVNYERVVDFSITGVSDPSARDKWVLQDVRFNNTRRIITPEDDPQAPKSTLKRPALPDPSQLPEGVKLPPVKPTGY